VGDLIDDGVIPKETSTLPAGSAVSGGQQVDVNQIS
jgi:hypothetical protein